MLGILVAAVVDAAARDNHYVRVRADPEIVVYDLLQPALRHHHGNMHTLVPGAGADADLQSADLLFRNDFNVLRGAPPGGTAVGADVVRAFGHFVQARHFQQQPLLNLVHYTSSPSRMVFISTSQAGASALSALREG